MNTLNTETIIDYIGKDRPTLDDLEQYGRKHGRSVRYVSPDGFEFVCYNIKTMDLVRIFEYLMLEDMLVDTVSAVIYKKPDDKTDQLVRDKVRMYLKSLGVDEEHPYDGTIDPGNVVEFVRKFK